MPRDTRVDLQQLLTFIDSYNLSHLIKDNDFILSIKQQHKKYYSYLTYIAEIQQYINDSNSGVIFRNDQYPFLKESCSDIGIAFFSSFHGNYKTIQFLCQRSIKNQDIAIDTPIIQTIMHGCPHGNLAKYGQYICFKLFPII